MVSGYPHPAQFGRGNLTGTVRELRKNSHTAVPTEKRGQVSWAHSDGVAPTITNDIES